MSEFRTEGILDIEISDRSMRETRSELEELGAEITLNGPGGGGRQSRQVLSSLGSSADSLDSIDTLADERNDLLEEVVDLLQAGGGGGGGIIPRPRGGGGGGSGGGLGGIIGALGVGLGGLLGLGAAGAAGGSGSGSGGSAPRDIPNVLGGEGGLFEGANQRRALGLGGGLLAGGAAGLLSGSGIFSSGSVLGGGGLPGAGGGGSAAGSGFFAPFGASPIVQGINQGILPSADEFFNGSGSRNGAPQTALTGRTPTGSARGSQPAAQPNIGTVSVTPQITVRIDGAGGGLSPELRKKFEELGPRIDKQIQNKLDEELRRQFSQLPGSF